jgi:hypothetical protein
MHKAGFEQPIEGLINDFIIADWVRHEHEIIWMLNIS